MKKKDVFLIGMAFALLWINGTVVSADDSLSDAITHGKISGEAKIWYETDDRGDIDMFDRTASALDAGIRLGYITGTYHGFGIGLNFYGVDDLWADDNYANRNYQPIEDGEDFAWLGEAYLTFNAGNTLLKIGRQNLDTPLVRSEDWILFPNNFMAYLFENSDLPQTTVTVIYLTEERMGSEKTFEDVCDEGALIFSVVNESLTGTTLTGYYYLATDDNWEQDAIYLSAETKIGRLALAGQYFYISGDTDYQDYDATNAYGFKLSADFDPVDVTFAVTSVDDGDLWPIRWSDNGWGTPLFTATLEHDGLIATMPDTNGYKLTVGYAPLKHLALTAAWGYYDHGQVYDFGTYTYEDTDNSSSCIELQVRYAASERISLYGAYMNNDFWWHESWGAGEDNTVNILRFWAKYQF